MAEEKVLFNNLNVEVRATIEKNPLYSIYINDICVGVITCVGVSFFKDRVTITPDKIDDIWIDVKLKKD